jgi:hypothetical protein
MSDEAANPRLFSVVLAAASAVRAQTVVYSQTSLASSGGAEPGLFDQFGLLAGPGSTRRDFFQRRSAFRNVLAAAANLLASGGAADAVAQLEEAYLRADGASNPADFVAGAAAADLAARIRQLIESLSG